MATPPEEINVELAGVYLSDVNHDGASDIVQVRFDAVDVWFNRAGEGFTARIIASGTPHVPAFAPRIRFVDIDGSATSDIVFGNAGRYQWIDPMGGQRPRLLTRVHNGLARRRASSTAAAPRSTSATCRRPKGACPSRATASRGPPSEASATRDTAPRPSATARAEAPWSPPWSPRSRRATSSRRSAARSQSRATSTATTTATTRASSKSFGASAPPTPRPWPAPPTRTGRGPRAPGSPRPPPQRHRVGPLAFSPYEALKGRERQSEVWDTETGTRLSTTHSTTPCGSCKSASTAGRCSTRS